MVSKDSLIGQQLANFHVIRMLGRGGMAEVYYGWDIKLQRPVAIKVIDARYRDNPEYAERFVKEARALAAWHHPNIVQIYYADETAGYYYYVMEYIPGLDLEQVIGAYARRQELIPVEDVLRIGRSAAEALDFAHRHGIIHRDVKPSNLIITGDGRVVLTDFGLAMNIEQGTLGQVFGSPHYIAPEQARNSAQAVPQSDLYSLGVILYQMLTGAVPFDDPSPTALAIQHLTQEPPLPRQHNPALSQDVEIVLLRALRKSPAQRYQSGRALMDALEHAFGTPVETSPFLPFSGAPASVGEAKSRASHIPVGQIVTQSLKSQPAIPQEMLHIPPLRTRRKKLNRTAWWGIGCGALLLVFFIAIAAIALISNPLGGLVSAFNPSPSPTVELSQTSMPVLLRTVTPSPSSSPTVTFSPTPSLTPSGTPTPTPTITLTLGPSPTPNGFHFQLFYDQTSFYLQNLLGADRPVNALSFERIDKHGKVDARFDSSLWDENIGSLQEGDCLVIRLLDYRDYLDPPECEDHQAIIATSSRNQEYIFWTRAKDSRQFRVFWLGEEIGTCELSDQACEIIFPEPP